jgi:short-subunit dehydrogenase
MDLRRAEEIEPFAALVRSRCAAGQPLRALVNNAGVALGGPFENLPMALYREAFEINYFGLVRLSQRLLPDLVASRGKLVVVGSLAGRIALPFLSPYTSTKFALEGFCDSVRRELNPLGVRTVLLEVAGVATPIWNKALRQDRSFADPKYAESLAAFTEGFILKGNEGLEADRAAAEIARILALKAPRARYLISKNPLLDRLKMRIPSRLLDRLVGRMFAMRYGEARGGG